MLRVGVDIFYRCEDEINITAVIFLSSYYLHGRAKAGNPYSRSRTMFVKAVTALEADDRAYFRIISKILEESKWGTLSLIIRREAWHHS